MNSLFFVVCIVAIVSVCGLVSEHMKGRARKDERGAGVDARKVLIHRCHVLFDGFLSRKHLLGAGGRSVRYFGAFWVVTCKRNGSEKQDYCRDGYFRFHVHKYVFCLAVRNDNLCFNGCLFYGLFYAG